MKKHSCGAILYVIKDRDIYIVLGMEKGQWFPFKGIRERGESNMKAAIREINEETCGSVQIDYVELKCNFATKRKYYHIGLVKISMNEYNNFYKNREGLLKNYNGIVPTNYGMFLEKTDIKMFKLDDITSYDFHVVTSNPINFYLPYLFKLQNYIRGYNQYIEHDSVINKFNNMILC